ncbi:MAG: PEP-CTERM sorting domain-containing protein [Leptolyngbya sp. RL_3_1]|nr:PEP-CTERM sorting domain-containing protein [Leptolyngbya sp. RL_3_1]
MNRIALNSFALAVVAGCGLAANHAAAQVTQTNTLPAGTRVDLSGLPTNTPISPTDPVFLDAFISLITVSNDPSTNNEFYDSGVFGAGRTLFGTEAGELIALDEGATVDYGSPTFTIDFADTVFEFGLRFADTSNRFATPQIEFFRDATLLDSILIDGTYDASTEFGFSAALGFDRVVIDVDTVGTGFGFDGVGITDLTTVTAPKVTTPTVTPTVVPEPASSTLLLGAASLGLVLRRRRA